MLHIYQGSCPRWLGVVACDHYTSSRPLLIFCDHFSVLAWYRRACTHSHNTWRIRCALHVVCFRATLSGMSLLNFFTSVAKDGGPSAKQCVLKRQRRQITSSQRQITYSHPPVQTKLSLPVLLLQAPRLPFSPDFQLTTLRTV